MNLSGSVHCHKGVIPYWPENTIISLFQALYARYGIILQKFENSRLFRLKMAK